MQSQVLEIIASCSRVHPYSNGNKWEIVLQLPQSDVVIQRVIAYPSELLRHIRTASGGYDSESHFIRRIDTGLRDGGSIQHGSDDRQGAEIDTNDQTKIRSHQSGLLRMLDAQSN